MVFLEVGWDQAEAVCALMRETGFREARAHADLQGILRMVEARL